MKRIFIAVKVNPEGELLRMFSTLKATLDSEKIKWVDTANIHLTLSFLGDIEEKRIGILSRILSDSCSWFGDFDINLTGTGIFKNLRDPKVLWVGIRSAEKLIQLNEIISEGLKINGFKIEERKFIPHLTLGRVKSVSNTENLKLVLEKYRDQQLQIVHVNEVILFESILMQSGPLYKALGRFDLS